MMTMITIGDAGGGATVGALGGEGRGVGAEVAGGLLIDDDDLCGFVHTRQALLQGFFVCGTG